MDIQDFLARIQERPELALVYCDDDICILRYSGPEGERQIRLGLWAVRRTCWEQIAEACRIPVQVLS